MSVKDAIVKQFDATWRELRKACEQIPDDQWATADVQLLMPGRQVLHAIGCAQGYGRDEEPNWLEVCSAFWGRDMDWEAVAADDLPGQQDMLAYLEHVRQGIDAWLADKTDADLLAPQTVFPWTGPNILSRCIYVIRHTQAHIGEINSELRRRGLPRIKWEA